MATRPEWVGELSQAGAIVRTTGLGFWWANIPAERWPNDPNWRQSLKKNWNGIYGDRRQEIVFIGTDMDEVNLRRRLDACLVKGKTLALAVAVAVLFLGIGTLLCLALPRLLSHAA